MNLRHEVQSLLRKATWSWQGLTAAFGSEKAIRQECGVALLSTIMAFVIEASTAERVILIVLPLLLIAVELLNTALEEVIDHICPEQHPMAKKAKDCGSAAVAVTALALAAAWAVVLFS